MSGREYSSSRVHSFVDVIEECILNGIAHMVSDTFCIAHVHNIYQ